MKISHLSLPVLTCLVTLLSPSAFAANSAASAGLADASVPESSQTSASGLQKQFAESTVITDAKLKAEAGSLSRISLKFNLAYYGPPVGDLGALNQPNPDGAVTTTATAISGAMGARYRFDPRRTLSLSAGVSNQYPFRESQVLDINNPSLYYDTAFRFGPVQTILSPGLTLITSDVYRKVGETYGLNFKTYSIYNLGESDFALSLDASVAYYLFNRDYIPARGKNKGDGKVQRMNVSFNPGLKYNLTKKLSLNTSLGWTFFNPRSNSELTAWNTRTVNQRVGVGYALTRDIYINPYLQFYPTKAALRTTTMNLSTVFSVL